MHLLLETLLERLSMPNVILGLVLAAIGLAAALLAKKITQAARGKKNIDANDHLLLIIKAVGLVMICIALILMIIK